MRRLLLLLATALLLGGVVACTSDSSDDTTTGSSTSDGGDDAAVPGGDDRQAYVDAVAAGFVAEDFPSGEDELTCMAETVVDDLGVEAIVATGATPEQFADEGPSVVGAELDDDRALEIGTALTGCLDDPGAVFAQGFAEGAGPEVTACLEAELDDETVAEIFALTLRVPSGGEPPAEFTALFGELAQACPDLLAGAG